MIEHPLNGQVKDLSTQFRDVPIKVIKTNGINVNNQPNHDVVANTLKLKFKAMYTYIFNSINQQFKRHITHCVNTHHQGTIGLEDHHRPLGQKQQPNNLKSSMQYTHSFAF